MKILNKILKKILSSKSIYRKSILLTFDLTFLYLSYLVYFNLYRSNLLAIDQANYKFLINFSILIAIPLYIFTGQYKSLTRYITNFSLYRMAIRNTFLFLIAGFATKLLGYNVISIKSFILIWLVFNVSTGLIRIALGDILNQISYKRDKKIKRVAIYGAGANGVELSNTITRSKSQVLKFFIDDNKSLKGRYISEFPIYHPNDMDKHFKEIDLVLLSIPKISRNKINIIVDKMQVYGLPVIKIPSLEDIADGLVKIEELRPIAIEDCLGRDPIIPIKELLEPGIKGKSICVVGAGGSIGSEIARQIIKFKPRKIVIFDLSEPSLYNINEELKDLKYNDIEIHQVLGSAKDYLLVKNILKKYQIDIVFHAAAYKHVPLVESNPIQGVSNNILSTYEICRACSDTKVAKMILISTDKAVRPTNVMGASKRFAELIVQSFSEMNSIQKDEFTCFSIVRFGNVLNSSGSVLPLFRKQIESRGPITLTDERVERYFMTIPEAAELVLQAAFMSLGGEVFLLDMGAPIKIKDLAEKMIRSSGLKIKDALNPEGDIEIKTIGLRPGEKLYEELLIDAESLKTRHPLIFKAKEKSIPSNKLFLELKNLEKNISEFNEQGVLEVLSKVVPEWDRHLK